VSENRYVLETHLVNKHFGGLQALKDVDVRVPRGQLLSVIGPNGAGKTTLFNVISGYYHPDGGRVLFKGVDISRLPPHRVSRMGLARSFQITNIFENLTVLENLRLAAQSRGKDSFKILNNYLSFPRYEEKAREILKTIGLEGKEELQAHSLPHGDKRKLEIGLVLTLDPEVLLLDEPTSGLSLEEIPSVLEVIQEVRQDPAKTLLLVEHKMDIVMSISDYIYVLHHGGVIAEGTPGEVSENEEVQKAYLGGAL